MGKFWEEWNPLICAACASLLAWCLISRFGIPTGTKDLLTAYVSTSGILVGFLATAKTILLSIDSTRVIRNLKRNNHYANLVNYIVRAIFSGIALAVISSVGAVIEWKAPTPWHARFIILWLFCAVHCGFATVRVIRLFKALMIANSKCTE